MKNLYEASLYTTQEKISITFINGETFLLKTEHLNCYNVQFYNMKPWIKFKNRELYRTTDGWYVKIQQISTAVKFTNLWNAIKEVFYYTNILYC